MRKIEIHQLSYDLTPVAGLALVGNLLQSQTAEFKHLDTTLPVRNGVSNADIVRS